MKSKLWLVLLFLTIIIVNPYHPLNAINETVSVQMVNVYLIATDQKENYITDLKPDELMLHEDGIPQKIVSFTNFAMEGTEKLGEKDVPLTVAFMVDISGSMTSSSAGQTRIDVVKDAAARLLLELRSDDQVMLVGFHRRPKIISALTSDVRRIGHQLTEQNAGFGQTALFDSLSVVLDELKTKSGRKVIVLGTDGEDTASHLQFEHVLDQVRASDVTILAFGLPVADPSAKGKFVLTRLAQASGGFAFFPTDNDELRKIMQRLRIAMRSQYSLWYQPDRKLDGSWRDIQISCTRSGIDLKYRSGYLAQ